MPDPFRTPPEFPLPCASAWGHDRYGLWMEIAVRGENGGDQVVQRLRWIEPGRFWMGSPEAEAERREDEGPQHEVTLSAGFWLADTACTQALWTAVMGHNPSLFQGEQCPVEQVSWDDVQACLAKLKARLPGCEPALPTEAQWEYACRAGPPTRATTPFSFGMQITSEQANFGGDDVFPKLWVLERSRVRTVAVKSLPANAWGLYEMHGNVWEWCADGLRDYTAEAQVDPLGPLEAGLCAARGGSCFNLARAGRSARRFAFDPGYASHGLGWRLSLRSQARVQEQEPEQPSAR